MELRSSGFSVTVACAMRPDITFIMALIRLPSMLCLLTVIPVVSLS